MAVATTEMLTISDDASAPDSDVEIIEPDHERYVRAAGDVLRVAIAAGVFVVLLLAAAIFRSIIAGAERDVLHLTSLVPAALGQLLAAVSGLLGFVLPVALVGTLIALRRLRVAIMVAVAGLLAGAAMWGINQVLSFQVGLPANLGELPTISYPGSRFLATSSAIVTVLGPWLPRWVRRTAIVSIAIIAFTRIASGQYVPYEVGVAVVLGWFAGAGVLAFFGSVNRRPSGSHVVEALQRSGISVRRLEMLGRGVRGSTVYRADTVEGDARFVKVFSADQREADLLWQFYRWLRLRDAADERPFSSLRRGVEHEALLSLKANDDGIATARLRAVAEVQPEGMLLAFDYVDGETLEGAGPERLTDDLLCDLWRIAATLRQQHIAHRDLRLAHMISDGNGPVLVDFSFGELAAPTELLHTDAAELLCSTAIEVGATRAVSAAVEVFGPEILRDMTPRLQPLALTAETRRAIGRQHGLLAEIQAEVQRVAGLEEVEYEELRRFKARTLVTAIVVVIAIYALIPRLAEVGEIQATLAQAQWLWVIPMLALLVVTWFGAAVGLSGSVPDRLPFFPVLTAQMAASFADILAPASVGGMALNTRFLQKRGVEPAVAVAGVGLNAVAGFIVHVVLLGVFILWAGSSDAATGEGGQTTFPWRVLLGIALIFVVVIALGWLIPPTRRLLQTRVVPILRDAAEGMRDLARKPRKIVALFGGSVIITFAFYGALVCAVQAFGGGPTPAQIGVAYLAAFSVAVLSPTPGGSGVLEAAMIAAFVRIGMTEGTAVSSVFLFRAVTFWFPIATGWVAFGFLQRRNDI